MTPPQEPSRPGRAAALFAESAAIMARLRAPGGCPWDREQTFASIRRYTLEETWEVLDAIDREDWGELTGELGDLLLQVLFYAEMGAEAGRFTLEDVLEHLNRKLVRRHPHVFGEEASAQAGNRASVERATGTAEVLANWEAIKRAERAGGGAGEPASLLDAVPRCSPALVEASRLGARAARVGFDWPDTAGLLAKVEEECREVAAESGSGASPEAIEEEIGDLLFTAVNLARHMKVEPELALRRANAKFRRRFAAMETAPGGPLEGRTAAELEILWVQAKEQVRRQEAIGQQARQQEERPEAPRP